MISQPVIDIIVYVGIACVLLFSGLRIPANRSDLRSVMKLIAFALLWPITILLPDRCFSPDSHSTSETKDVGETRSATSDASAKKQLNDNPDASASEE